MAQNIDRSKLQQIAQMNDSDFAALIRAVVLAAGGSEETVRKAIAAAPQIKEKLKTADEKELAGILSLIGKGKAEKVLKTLGI